MILKGNWRDYFTTFDDIIVEVGFGASSILPKIAAANTHALLVGVELVPHYCAALENRLDHGNIIVVNADITHEVQHIPDCSISKYFFFFPSPFTHRVFSYGFHRSLYRTLKKGGIVKVVTDDADYYQSIIRIFNEKLWNYTPWTPFPFRRKQAGSLIGTRCERVYGSKYYMECYKK